MISELLGIVAGLMDLHPAILVVILLVAVFVAYKVFKLVMRIVMIAGVFAALPVIAFLMGMQVDITFGSIIGSAIFGIMAYFAFTTLRTGMKIIRIVFSPFKRLFRDKPKQKVERIIVKEKKEKD